MITNYGNRGTTLEDLVENIFELYPNSCFARQRNLWVPINNGRGGSFPVKGKGSPVDFVGVLRGVHVVLECKEYKKGHRLSLGENRYPEKEVLTQLKYAKAGSFCFTVVAFWELGAFGICGFNQLYEAWNVYKKVGKPASIPVEDMPFRTTNPAQIPKFIEKFIKRGIGHNENLDSS